MSRAINIKDVIAKTSLKKTAIYAAIKSDGFPAPIKLGSRSAWIEEEVDDYLASRSQGTDVPRNPDGRKGRR